MLFSAAMGLTAFEYQCGRGVRCGEDTARRIGAAAAAHDIRMSIHAPYFINLSSEEHERMEKNIGYVLETAQLAVPLGALTAGVTALAAHRLDWISANVDLENEYDSDELSA